MLRTSTISTLSGQRTSEKFSFGKASRFQSASASASKQLQRSRSSPAWSHQTSTTASDAGGLAEASRDFTVTTEPSRVFSTADPSVEEPAGPSTSSSRRHHDLSIGAMVGGSDDEDFFEDEVAHWQRHPPPPASYRIKAPRLDSSINRLDEPRERAAYPRAKSYDPALTLGLGTCAAYQHAPHFSFGGGPSRLEDNKKKEHLAHITNTASQRKGKGRPSAVTLMDLKEAIKPTRRQQAPLSRGFGTQARLPVKGGAMQGTISPGPAAYELPRDGDPEPVWASSRNSGCHWSKRTADRPSMRNGTGNPENIAPGDHIADNQFKATGPTPVFGHPAHDLSVFDCAGLDPARYNVPSPEGGTGSNGVAFAKGKRGGLVSGLCSGPLGAYSPKADVCFSYAPSVSFTRSCRLHESDLIDPDEPPGPGAHTVRVDPKPSDKPSAGLPKEAKMRTVPGLGPDGPAPGDAFKSGLPSFLDQKGRSMGVMLRRPVSFSPGPADTAGGDVGRTDLATRSSAPSWGELVNRSSVRKPPWRELSQPPVFQLKSGEKLIMTNVPIHFKPTGPKWSLQPRRKHGAYMDEPNTDPKSEAMVLTTSLG